MNLKASPKNTDERIEALLADPAIRAIEKRMEQEADERALAKREAVLAMLDDIERQLAARDVAAAEFALREAELIDQLAALQRARDEQVACHAGLRSHRADLERELRTAHGEDCVLHATALFESRVHQLRAEISRLEKAPSVVRAPRWPQDWNPPIVPNHAPRERATAARHELAQVELVLPEIQALRRARKAPAALRTEIELLLARAGVPIPKTLTIDELVRMNAAVATAEIEHARRAQSGP